MDTTTSLKTDYLRNVALDVILTVLLCGLWNIVVQHYQCKALNYLLKEEKYKLWRVGLLSLITCGIYYFYFEYSKSIDFQRVSNQGDSSDSVLALVLAIFGFGWIYDALLQSKINDFILAKPFHPSNSD